MHPQVLLSLTSQLIEKVWAFDQPADKVMNAFFRQHPQLGQRDRQWGAQTLYRCLRARGPLEAMAKTGPVTLFRGLAILAFAGPDEGLMQALSPQEKAWAQERRCIPTLMNLLQEAHDFPDEWMSRLQKQRPDDAIKAAQALNQAAPLDLRVNTLKGKREAVLKTLQEQYDAHATPWSPWGIRLLDKPSLSHHPLFESGLIEIQDEGSQLLAALLGAKRGQVNVDFCAGAGGKTLAIGAMMKNTGRLYAFDTSAKRLAMLGPRLTKSGLSQVYSIAISHERDERIQKLYGKIDRVLVDAPCSGTGTLRRHPDLKWRESFSNLALRVKEQQTILENAALLLKSGGRLVYATCSWLEEENLTVVKAFEDRHPEFKPQPALACLASQGIVLPSSAMADNALQLWPHLHQTDGFFAKVWQRD